LESEESQQHQSSEIKSVTACLLPKATFNYLKYLISRGTQLPKKKRKNWVYYKKPPLNQRIN